MSGFNFDEIPFDLALPGAWIESLPPTVTGPVLYPKRVLIVGQRLATGSVPELVLKQVTRAEQAEAYWGRGSMIAAQFAAFKKANPNVEVWGIALDDDGAATAHVRKLDWTVTTAEAGTAKVRIGGHVVRFAISAGDTADDISAAFVAAIEDAASTYLPFSAAVDGVNANESNLTAKNKGEAAAQIDVGVLDDDLPGGVSVAVTVDSAGSGNPEVDAVFTAIGDDLFDHFCVPYADATNIAHYRAEAVRRWDALVRAECDFHVGFRGDFSATTTLVSSVNDEFLFVHAGGLKPRTPWERCAEIVATLASESDPARPVQNMVLHQDIPEYDRADAFTDSERNLLIKAGISTVQTSPTGTVSLEYVASTRTKDDQGAPYTGQRDYEDLQSVIYLRKDLRAYIFQAYPRYKLADDTLEEVPAGKAIARPKDVKASLGARARSVWGPQGIGVIENVDKFIEDMDLVKVGDEVHAILVPDLMNQFRRFKGRIQPVL